MNPHVRQWIRRAARTVACAVAVGAGMGTAAAMDHMGLLDRNAPVQELSAPSARAMRVDDAFEVATNDPRDALPEAELAMPELPEASWDAAATITGATPHRMIHFTFDDGPSRITTPRLLAELDRLGIKATFFVTTGRMASPGGRARAERAILQEIAERGHQIGNHSITHRQLPLLSPVEVLEEVRGANDLIESVTGTRPSLIRPPGGSRSARIDTALAGLGMSQVLWNVGSGDFQVRSADEVVDIFRRVLARRERDHGERGGIVLLHDTHGWSVAALPRIVAYLEQRNCELLEGGEELFDIVDDLSPFYAARPDDLSDAPPAEPPADWIESRQADLRASTRQRCSLVALGG